MRRTSLLLNKAGFHLRNAGNAIHRIFPFVKENKVMIIAINNLFMAFNSSMLVVLEHSVSLKKLQKIPEDFDSRLVLLNKVLIGKHKGDGSYIKLGRDLKSYMIAHRNSSIEFSRGDNYVICDGDFQYKMLSIKILEGFHSKTKLFIDEAIRLTYIK